MFIFILFCKMLLKYQTRKAGSIKRLDKMAEKEDWRLCVDWLGRCQIIQPDHRVNTPQAQVFDLASLLRDGVLLCHLLNQLHSGAIDLKDFSQRPQMSQVMICSSLLTNCSIMSE